MRRNKDDYPHTATTPGQHGGHLRAQVDELPSGWRRLLWLGPGLVWMVSAVGSGSVLFTPRVAARYEYGLLWVGVLVCALMWVMILEASRYTIYTGRTLLDGFRDLRGPRHWAVWVIFVPQWLACVAGVAGLGALVGSALAEVLPGSHVAWGCAWISGSAALVFGGWYSVVEKLSNVVGFALVGLAIGSAVAVRPDTGALASGVVPGLPDNLDLQFILPWIGTILAGSMGIIWFSYWVAARRYAGPVIGLEETQERDPHQRPAPREERLQKMHRWYRLVGATAALGVITGAAVLISFMVLGAELLAPRGLIPSGADVAADLTRLFSDLWGSWGRWALLVAIVLALGGSILANQDGWSRSFADMTKIVLNQRSHERAEPRWFVRLARRLPFDPRHAGNLHRFWLVSLGGILPVAVVLIFRDPVAIMSASGIIAAFHTPFLIGATLLVNRRQLPPAARPGAAMTTLLALSGLLFLGVSLAQGWFWARGG